MFKNFVKSAALTILFVLLSLGSLSGIYLLWLHDKDIAEAILPEPTVLVSGLPEQTVFVPTDSDVKIDINLVTTAEQHMLEPAQLFQRARRTGEKVLCAPNDWSLRYLLFEPQGDDYTVYVARENIEASWLPGIMTDRLMYSAGNILAVPKKQEAGLGACSIIGLSALAIVFGFVACLTFMDTKDQWREWHIWRQGQVPTIVP